MNWPYFVAGFVWGMYSYVETRRSNLDWPKAFLLWAGGIVGITLFLHFVLGV